LRRSTCDIETIKKAADDNQIPIHFSIHQFIEIAKLLHRDLDTMRIMQHPDSDECIQAQKKLGRQEQLYQKPFSLHARVHPGRPRRSVGTHFGVNAISILMRTWLPEHLACPEAPFGQREVNPRSGGGQYHR
jgi:hypothetical protein